MQMYIILIFFLSFSARDHIGAQSFLKFKEQALMDKLNEDDEAITSAMKVAYHLTISNQPKSQFSATVDLLDSLGLNL